MASRCRTTRRQHQSRRVAPRLSRAQESEFGVTMRLEPMIHLPPGHLYPGTGAIDPAVLPPDIFRQQAGPVFSACSTCSRGGGAGPHDDRRAQHHAVHLGPSIIMQLMTAVSPHLEALKKEGEAGP